MRYFGATGFVGTTNPVDALFWLSEVEKILDEGMQCPDVEKLRIAGFLLGGEARNWWNMERSIRVHTWESFKAAFDAYFCPEAFKEAKRVEFEGLQQGLMLVLEYEKKFLELFSYCSYLIPDDERKKRRFLDGLNDLIANSISGAAHPTFQSLRDAALEVERQRFIRGSRRQPFEGTSSDSQGSSKKGSFSSGSSSGGRFRGSRFIPILPPSQKSIHSGQFAQQLEGDNSSTFQGSRSLEGPRVACNTCNKVHSGLCQRNSCFHCGQYGHFRRECPFLIQGSTETSETDFQASGSSFHPQQSGGFRPQGSYVGQGSDFSSTGQSSSAVR